MRLLLLWLRDTSQSPESRPGQQGAPQAEPGSRAELPRRGRQQGHAWMSLGSKGLLPYRCQHSHGQCHPTQGTALAQLPLPCLPDLVILSMPPALSMTLQFRATPSFFISILHKIDVFSPLSNIRLYESLHFFIGFFFLHFC